MCRSIDAGREPSAGNGGGRAGKRVKNKEKKKRKKKKNPSYFPKVLPPHMRRKRFDGKQGIGDGHGNLSFGRFPPICGRWTVHVEARCLPLARPHLSLMQQVAIGVAFSFFHWLCLPLYTCTSRKLLEENKENKKNFPETIKPLG